MIEKLNYRHNSSIELPDALINGQGLEPVSRLKYGLCPASFNACEMIAIYNLLYLKGIHKYSLADIFLLSYKKVWAFWGIFGSNVYLLDRFFTSEGIKIKKTYNRNEFFYLLDEHKKGIFSFWNSDNPFDGVHTVCIEKTNDRYKIYNRTNKRAYPCTYKDKDSIINNRRFMAGYICPEK